MNVITMYEIPKMGNLRTKMIDNQPWFVAMDVTGILKYRNSRDAVRIHVNECDRRNDISIFNSDGRRQKVTFINESGLLQLIKGSQMPRAKELQNLIMHEVLPAIHGNHTEERTGIKLACL